MIKYYCDYCGNEIQGERLQAGSSVKTVKERNGKKMTVCVYVERENALSSASDDITGHFCLYCVLDTLHSLDDRPKAG